MIKDRLINSFLMQDDDLEEEGLDEESGEEELEDLDESEEF
jgi:hypothetical protein